MQNSTAMAENNRNLKILLGGVPLGCNNVGDEAIVSCVVQLLRTLVPDATMTVCTREEVRTAAELQVNTAPLYGFGENPDWRGFSVEVRRHDVFLWFGATGLSDYPATTVKLLRIAQGAGVKTIVWGVGMNSELNPAFYRAGGRRLRLLNALTHCTLGVLDWRCIYEGLLTRRVGRRIRRALEGCALVVLRDAESREAVECCGYHHALVGADTAILLESAPKPPLPVVSPGVVRIGFCISEQSALRQLDELVEFWDKLLERPEIRIVLIPMNPVTDKRLMRNLAVRSKCPERIECLEEDAPAVVQACVSQCRAVVSSRLHLLILAANVGVPFIGIERGSKISTWLRQFGREPAGSVEDCDFAEIHRQLEDILAESPEVAWERILRVTESMHQRLDDCAAELRRTLI